MALFVTVHSSGTISGAIGAKKEVKDLSLSFNLAGNQARAYLILTKFCENLISRKKMRLILRELNFTIFREN